MRCPECGSFMHFSFMAEVGREMVRVYQCRAVPVYINVVVREQTVTGHTLDHSDRFYTPDYTRVVPVAISKSNGDWTLRPWVKEAA